MVGIEQAFIIDLVLLSLVLGYHVQGGCFFFNLRLCILNPPCPVVP